MKHEEKQTCLQEIADLLTEMRPAFERIGVKRNFPFLHPRSNELPSDIIIEAWRWLKYLHAGVYADYMRVRKLLPEEIWKRYALLGGFENHREVVMLRDAGKLVRSHVTHVARPSLFKRSFVEEMLKNYEAGAKDSEGNSGDAPV